MFNFVVYVSDFVSPDCEYGPIMLMQLLAWIAHIGIGESAVFANAYFISPTESDFALVVGLGWIHYWFLLCYCCLDL